MLTVALPVICSERKMNDIMFDIPGSRVRLNITVYHAYIIMRRT